MEENPPCFLKFLNAIIKYFLKKYKHDNTLEIGNVTKHYYNDFQIFNKKETLDKYGAVSLETVREMAEGVKRISGADYGLATSGIAGPGGGTEGKAVGTICIGLATPESTIAKKRKSVFARLDDSYGNRLRNKQWFTMLALETLRRELLGIKKNES